MVGYITILFVFLSAISFFLAPTTYSKPFCVWEMASFFVTGVVFMHHKIRRNGLICFDTFFIPTFFLINYAHAVFIYPDDQFLPPFRFRTNNDIIPYAALIASLGLFCFVFVLRLARGFEHLYPRLMAMFLSLIALSWFFQAQQLQPGEASVKGIFLKNKLNIVSTLLFSVSLLFVGSRGMVIFLIFMLLLLIDTYYVRVRLRVLLPAMALGMILMIFLAITRVSSFNLGNANLVDSVKYGIEVVMESPSILWLLLTDFVVNAKTLYDGIDYTTVNGYMMGTSYVQYLFVFLPMGGSFFTKLLTGLDMDEVVTGYLLTRFSDATYGLGTNMVGDIYMNFSFIGVFVLMALLGFLVARVEIPASKYAFYAYMALFANCIFLVRADIFSWLTFFVFFLIFDWLMRIHVTYDETEITTD